MFLFNIGRWMIWIFLYLWETKIWPASRLQRWNVHLHSYSNKLFKSTLGKYFLSFFLNSILDRKFPFQIADTLAGNGAEIRAGSASSYILRISLSRKSTLSRKVWRTIHTLAPHGNENNCTNGSQLRGSPFWKWRRALLLVEQE